jgi:hypothetical protein
MVTAERTTLDVQDVKQFVTDWYVALDRHVSWEEVRPYLHDEVEFVFPEVTVRDYSGLLSWYETVTRKFFDEAHRVDVADVTLDGDSARVHVVVNWRTRVWDAPNASSTVLEYDADQDWVVGMRSDGRLGIKTYVVKGLTPRGDTPPLS